MAREESLQAIQTDTGQNRHQQGVVVHGGYGRCNSVNLLRFDGQQLHWSRPDLLRLGAVRRVDRYGLKGPLAQTICSSGRPYHRQHLISRERLAAQQWLHQGLGHPAQADHTEGRNHRSWTQRAVAPQAGDGAAAASCCCSASASRLTTVGVEASSWLVLVTVTQLGANRKMLSPTRSW